MAMKRSGSEWSPEACDPNELMPVVMTFARELAAKSLVGIKDIKKAIYQGLDLTLQDGLILETESLFRIVLPA